MDFGACACEVFTPHYLYKALLVSSCSFFFRELLSSPSSVSGVEWLTIEEFSLFFCVWSQETCSPP